MHRKQLCRLHLPDLATLSLSSSLSSGAGKFVSRPLDNGHPEYQALHAMFHESMTMHREDHASRIWCDPPQVDILGIQEVINSKTQKPYELARIGVVNDANCPPIQGISAWKLCNEKAAEVCSNEYLLFHGCPVGAIESICRNGFDPQLGGATGKMFGLGTYFAENASHVQPAARVLRTASATIPPESGK